MSEAKTSLTYRDAGVDIDAGNTLVERIKPHTQRTKRPEMISDIGGFGALFSLPTRYENPVLVSGTDGVGTKVKLAIRAGLYQRIGIDLVAMCVNDIVVCGAEPLFFLDYFATGKLDVDVAEAVIEGIAEGCVQSGAALSGGETAEMPGFYNDHEFDLAGFCVGVVEKDKIIDRSRVQVGDVVIGLASSGPHSNGYSLIRKIVRASGAELDDPCAGSTLGEVLLEPTRIYVKPLLAAYKEFNIHAVAHITGGGLIENIPRVMPSNTRAIISRSTWQRPKIFDWLQEKGNVAEEEMLHTFNCGIGMAVIAAKDEAEDLMSFFRLQGLDHWQIGEIASTEDPRPFVEIID